MTRINKLVHANQHGFLKAISIQDCLPWAYEYLDQCQQTGNQFVALKPDFEKAFDILEHKTVTEILRAKGFGEK